MKVSAVVTEMTEPNKIIRIAELSISLFLPKAPPVSVAVRSCASAKVVPHQLQVNITLVMLPHSFR
jgi:hypothetical protein